MFLIRNPLHVLYWLLIIILVFLISYLLVKLFPLYGAFFSFLFKLFLPFIIACFIAYLLFPIIKKLREYNIHRTVSILLIYLLFFVGTGVLIYLFYPIAMLQLRDLNEQLPYLIGLYEDFIYQLYESTSFLPETVHDKMDDLFTNIEKSLENVTGKLVGGFTKIFDLIILITVIPVLVYYFLKDYEKIKRFLKKLIPTKYRKTASEVVNAIDESLGSYIRGQFLVICFISLTTFVIFHLLGVKYALLLAIIMGLTNIIPYFGPIIGATPAVLITITVSTKLVIFVIITVLVIQLLENNFLSPYIVGRTTNIHPVGIIFALLVGGKIGGVLGLILAVPTLAVIKNITTQVLAIRHYD